ncbi:MAG: putative glycoside hydrolase, partial [Gemmatimonadales bacterium]
MHFQKITLAVAAVAASALACTGTHEASGKGSGATPDRQMVPVAVDSDTNPTGVSTLPAQRVAADTDTVARAHLASARPHPTPPVLDSLMKGTLAARGLYVFRFGANTRRLKHLIGIADSTEINALIIDVKDEFGLNYDSSDPMVKKNAGTQVKAHNLRELVDTIRAHGILPVARIVVFKDSVTARNNPDHTIRKADGSAWHDKKGQTWVNPYANAVWEYNFRVGEEAIKMGFGEIQFDYIRFPEPYKSLPPQVFPEQNGRTKPQVLAEFLSAARARFAKMGVRTTADI